MPSYNPRDPLSYSGHAGTSREEAIRIEDDDGMTGGLPPPSRASGGYTGISSPSTYSRRHAESDSALYSPTGRSYTPTYPPPPSRSPHTPLYSPLGESDDGGGDGGY